MVFWFFIKRVDQGLLPSERGLILQEKDAYFNIVEPRDKLDFEELIKHK